MSNTGRLDRVLCFEWARGIAATMVVFLHVMSGITDNYSMEAIGGVASLSGLFWTCCLRVGRCRSFS